MYELKIMVFIAFRIKDRNPPLCHFARTIPYTVISTETNKVSEAEKSHFLFVRSHAAARFFDYAQNDKEGRVRTVGETLAQSA